MAKKDELEENADLSVDAEGAIKEALDDHKNAPEDSDENEASESSAN
jgi:hypothetical protein